MAIPTTRADLAALVVSILLFLAVAGGVAACGDDDLFFPGELPPTSTPRPTSTPTEGEEDDTDEEDEDDDA